jgi:methyl-accepting chemotaxis protein
MDKITQQNAALVEEAAAAAKSMEDQTDSLTSMVSAFDLGDREPVTPHHDLRPAPRFTARPQPARPQPVREPEKTRKLARASVLPAALEDWKEF